MKEKKLDGNGIDHSTPFTDIHSYISFPILQFISLSRLLLTVGSIKLEIKRLGQMFIFISPLESQQDRERVRAK